MKLLPVRVISPSVISIIPYDSFAPEVIGQRVKKLFIVGGIFLLKVGPSFFVLRCIPPRNPSRANVNRAADILKDFRGHEVKPSHSEVAELSSMSWRRDLTVA